MPETVYYGERPVIALGAATSTKEEPSSAEATAPEEGEKTQPALSSQPSNDATEVQVAEKTYLQSLKIWSKDAVNPAVSYRKAFLRPFVLCTYPTVLWASLVYGMSLSKYFRPGA